MDDKPKHMRPGNHQKPLELLLYFYADEKLCAKCLEEYITPPPQDLNRTVINLCCAMHGHVAQQVETLCQGG